MVMIGESVGLAILAMWSTFPVNAVKKAKDRGVQLTIVDWHASDTREPLYTNALQHPHRS
jgi:hypothetical protein